MNFGNVMRGAALGLALTGLATAAEATTFNIDDLTITGDSLNDPGLVIQVNPLTPQSFDLNSVGDWELVPLFEIWSEECCINFEDDWTPQEFTMQLSFDQPPPPFGGSNDGTTTFFFVPALVWEDDSVFFNFGALGDGLLRLDLSNISTFEYDCHSEDCRTTVYGKFKLKQLATEVPEPATIALLGAGLLGLGLVGRRRTTA